MDKSGVPINEQVEKFDMLYGLFNSLFSEIKNLTKRKPEESLNEMKVRMINKVLGEIKEVLANYPIGQFLEKLDAEILPSNSDAVLILSQYMSAMDQFKNRYYGWDKEEEVDRWFTKEKPGTPYKGPKVYRSF